MTGEDRLIDALDRSVIVDAVPIRDLVQPTTEAGRRLLEREAYNSRSFALITAEDILEIERQARATATPGLPSVTALVLALHDVDDDVQFIRRDARNLPVLAGRLRAVLSASGETEARATATPGLDVALDDVMEGFRARHPNVSVFATATPGLREALHKAICYSDHTILSRDFEMSRRRCVIAEGVVRAVLSASGETEARATATPGLREALMGLYAAVGAAPAVRETPRQRKVLEAWKAVRAVLSASGETESPDD